MGFLTLDVGWWMLDVGGEKGEVLCEGCHVGRDYGGYGRCWVWEECVV